MSDLEDRERHLRELNEYLDQKQNEVVRRAENLIKEQNEYLQKCVSVNVRKLQESENDLEIDTMELDNLFQFPDDIQSSDHVEQMSTGSTTDVLDDPLPRQQAPTPITVRQNKSRPHSTTPSTVLNEFAPDDNQEDSVFTEDSTNMKAAFRLQKVRYKSLEKKYNDIVDRYNSKEKESNRHGTRIKELENKLKIAEKKLRSEQQKGEKRRESIATLEQENQQTRSEIAQLQKELKDARKCLGKNQRNSRTSDVRLGRALEEAEKYRRMLQRAKNDSKANVDVQRGETDRLQQENKKLLKQKCELLNAFKKQVRLIDILKKQKAHLEAMKLLEFTEEQFIKTLEIGEKLAN